MRVYVSLQHRQWICVRACLLVYVWHLCSLMDQWPQHIKINISLSAVALNNIPGLFFVTVNVV